MRITGEDYPGSVRVIRPRGTSRAASVADSYINPERLMDDLARLYASRDRVVLSLTALDCAAIAAGTPIRSTSARERFWDLDVRLRDIEAVARQAWQSEVAAAGGYKPALRPILMKAGKCDARGLNTLLSKDGDHLDTTEYDELLSVLEGAIVQAREAGIEEYAASLFINLDANTLKRLVRDAANLKYVNADDKLLVQRLGDLLAELRDLFSVVAKLPDLKTRFPKFWIHLDGMDPSVLLTLLQTGRGWSPDGPFLKGANPNLLAMIADRVLAPEARTKNDPDFATASFWRKPTMLRLLREDQLSGGKGLSLFLSAPEYNAAGFATVSRHLESLTESSFINLSGAVQFYSDQEISIRAALLKTHFTNAFDKGSNADVLQAASLLEIVIANTSKLGDLSKPMRAALAVGFAGMMTHQQTRDDLLLRAKIGSGTGQNDAADAKVSWRVPGLDIDGTRLGKFLVCLADEPMAVKTIAAAFGPTIASTARAAKQLPVGANLPGGLGFLYGSFLRKFDSDANAKRAFFDGLGLGLTVLFASAGGLTLGLGAAVMVGALGSGVLQNITSLVDVEPKNSFGLPMDDGGIREFFTCAYVLAGYKWLEKDTRTTIENRILGDSGEPKSTTVTIQNMANIRNRTGQSSVDLIRLKVLLIDAVTVEPNGEPTTDALKIDSFITRAGKSTDTARRVAG